MRWHWFTWFTIRFLCSGHFVEHNGQFHTINTYISNVSNCTYGLFKYIAIESLLLLRNVEKGAILVAVLLICVEICQFSHLMLFVHCYHLIVYEMFEWPLANEMTIEAKATAQFMCTLNTFRIFAEMRCHTDFPMINYNEFHINRKTGNRFTLYIRH